MFVEILELLFELVEEIRFGFGFMIKLKWLKGDIVGVLWKVVNVVNVFKFCFGGVGECLCQVVQSKFMEGLDGIIGVVFVLLCLVIFEKLKEELL